MIVGAELTPYTVGVDIVGKELEGVGVAEERIALRIVDAYGAVGSLGIAYGIGIENVVAGKHIT